MPVLCAACFADLIQRVLGKDSLATVSFGSSASTKLRPVRIPSSSYSESSPGSDRTLLTQWLIDSLVRIHALQPLASLIRRPSVSPRKSFFRRNVVHHLHFFFERGIERVVRCRSTTIVKPELTCPDFFAEPTWRRARSPLVDDVFGVFQRFLAESCVHAKHPPSNESLRRETLFLCKTSEVGVFVVTRPSSLTSIKLPMYRLPSRIDRWDESDVPVMIEPNCV